MDVVIILLYLLTHNKILIPQQAINCDYKDHKTNYYIVKITNLKAF